ncbi:hypothetical protein DFQ27_001034 [Actinomortierella ambigua]|uniref:Uncharacterized protein n=1 Tax=Actinomortierella ambigua TaxID=1343610 RepID=A0A9P6QEY2_9FUNG|nr:hypothetical protein DFQ27_001034 [Actinomortierella ambigua]
MPPKIVTIVVDDASEPGRVGKALVYKSSLAMSTKIAYYNRVFKDPANATQLLAREKPDVGDSSPDAVNQDATKKFRLFQFNISCTNCEHIFRAAHFLSYRLRDKACLEDPTFVFGLTKHSVSFKEMAAELAAVEPTLRGVSAHTLLRLYSRLVEDRRRLETFNATLAGGMTVDTMMTRLAAEMVELDDCIRERETQQKANKDGAKRRQVMDDEEKVGTTYAVAV